MKATANGQEFEGKSWTEITIVVAVRFKLRTDAPQRVQAARLLLDGASATLDGVTITPTEA